MATDDEERTLPTLQNLGGKVGGWAAGKASDQVSAGAASLVSGPLEPFTEVADSLSAITSRTWWARVLTGAAGLWVMYLGLWVLVLSNKQVQSVIGDAVGTAATVTPVGKAGTAAKAVAEGVTK